MAGGGRLPSAKKRRGLTPALRRALDGDVLEDDLDRTAHRRALDVDDEDDDAPLVDGDDEITSDEEDFDDIPAVRRQRARAGKSSARDVRPSARDALDDDDDDDDQSIGSSLDGAEMADLSQMLDGESDGEAAPAANAEMLRAAGLRPARRTARARAEADADADGGDDDDE